MMTSVSQRQQGNVTDEEQVFTSYTRLPTCSTWCSSTLLIMTVTFCWLQAWKY